MKKILQIISKYYRIILKVLFLYGPSLVCFFILYQFTREELLNSKSEEFYKLLIGSIAITATLSGLMFRLSGIIKDSKEIAETYKKIGERFLHTVILMVMALIIKYSQINIVDYVEIIWLKNIVNLYLRILLFFFFFYGIGYFTFAIGTAHIILMKNNEKPYD